jgi:hypothetical protein
LFFGLIGKSIKSDHSNLNAEQMILDKLVVKNDEERARLERLKADMSYAKFNRSAATYLEKSNRKFKAEQMDVRGRENIRTWLESPDCDSIDKRCDFVEDVEKSTTLIPYISPTIKNELDTNGSVKSVLNAVLTNVEVNEDAAAGRKRCNGRRIPMTDYCLERKYSPINHSSFFL